MRIAHQLGTRAATARRPEACRKVELITKQILVAVIRHLSDLADRRKSDSQVSSRPQPCSVNLLISLLASTSSSPPSHHYRIDRAAVRQA